MSTLPPTSAEIPVEDLGPAGIKDELHIFAIIENEHRQDDDRLKDQSERQELIAFEVPNPPDHWSKPTSVVRLPDHRSVYLTYQGPISRDRGIVTRIRDGTHDWIELNETKLVARLYWDESITHGQITKWSGNLTLTKYQEDPERWSLTMFKLRNC